MTNWTPRQRKAYHRLIAGMIRHREKRCRFMTLTTSDNMCRTIRESWNLLLKRIKIATPWTFISEGYISFDRGVEIWGEDHIFDTLTFEYCRIETSEGIAGVFHIIFYGCFIPQCWLSDTWYEITGGAFVVDVRQVYRSIVHNRGRLSSYCIEQYTGGQSDFLSYHCSYNWIFKGAWKEYDRLRESCKDYSVLIGFKFGNPVYYIDKKVLRYKWELAIKRGYALPKVEATFIDDSFDEFMRQAKEFSKQPHYYW